MVIQKKLKYGERTGNLRSTNSGISSNSFLGLSALVVDDDASVRTACGQILRMQGAEVDFAGSLSAAKVILRRQRFDLLLLDLKLPDGSGIDLLELARKAYSDMAVVVMTAFATVSSAVEAMRIGASDYLTKPFSSEELAAILDSTSQRATISRESRLLRERLRSQSQPSGLIGHSEEIEKLHRILSKVTFSTHPVLILGERGTGKETLARSIHENGPNAEKPFFLLDCRSSSVEQQLFGRDSIAPPDQQEGENGLLAAPDGGTVCLDEIDELSLDLQARLVRTLQDKRVSAGDRLVGKSISVRILASSSRDLATLVDQGKFRKDLFFRLNIVNMKLPALRERKNDIGLLAMHFLAIQDRQNGSERTLSQDLLDLLKDYAWPGNIRELESAIGYACAFSSDALLRIHDMPPDIQEFSAHDRIEGSEPKTTPSNEDGLSNNLTNEIVPIAELEKQVILSTICQMDGDKIAAARALGIGKTTLYRKLKQYNLDNAMS